MLTRAILFSICLATFASVYGYGGKPSNYHPVKPKPYIPKPVCYGYKKVTYNYYYGYSYAYGAYNKQGYYTCRNYGYGNNWGKCQYTGYGGSSYGGGYGAAYSGGYAGGYGGGHGYGYGYTDCKSQYCGGYVYQGQSKCHGKVKLSKGYYYTGEQCSYENGLCGYKSYLGYYAGKCSCKTTTCSKSVKACYKYGYYYYEGYVQITYPCGCQCSSPAKGTHYLGWNTE